METLLAADYAEVDEMDIDMEDLTPVRPTTGVLRIPKPKSPTRHVNFEIGGPSRRVVSPLGLSS